MARIKFNEKGFQRKFFNLVLERINCPSLRELINRGIDVNYSTLKNYYSEKRRIPLDLFEELLGLSGLKKEDVRFELVSDNWGQVVGGKKSRK
jgi:hypothetical protein